MDDKEKQKKYMEYKLFQDQLKQTQSQLQLLEEQVFEIVYAHQSLDELKSIKKGTEILVPVSNGIFAKATLGETDKLIVNVGASSAVSKSIIATQEQLNNQLKEIQGLQAQLIEAHQKLEGEFMKIQADLAKEG